MRKTKAKFEAIITLYGKDGTPQEKFTKRCEEEARFKEIRDFCLNKNARSEITTETCSDSVKYLITTDYYPSYMDLQRIILNLLEDLNFCQVIKKYVYEEKTYVVTDHESKGA